MVPGRDDITVELATDGAFELESPYEGLAWLEVSGVGHRPSRLAVLLDQAPQSLELRLGTNLYRKDFGELRLRVSQGERERFFRARPRPDGRYEVVLPAIEGIAALSWTSALAGCCGETAAGRDGPSVDRARWRADGAGQYRWEQELSGGPTRIVFNPRKLPPPDKPVDVRFADDSGLLAQVAAIETEAAAIERAYFVAVRSQAEQAGTTVRSFAVGYPWAEHSESLAMRAEAESDPRLRRVAWAAYFARPPSAHATETERGRAAQALQEIPPDDAVWAWGRVATALRASGDTEAARAYAARVLKRHPDPEVVSQVLWLHVTGWGATKEDQAAARQALATSRFADTQGQQRLTQLNARNAGPRPLPAFELAALEDRGQPLDSATLRGKVHLLSFWATWCEPCVEEMPALHRLHERFADSGLRVVSVAVDNQPNDVAEFRDQRWPMPWRHARVDRAQRTTLWAALGLGAQMPAAVLVDEQGSILAAGDPNMVLATTERILLGEEHGNVPPQVRKHVRALEAMDAALKAEAGGGL